MISRRSDHQVMQRGSIMLGMFVLIVAGVGVGLMVRYQLRLSAVPANALLLRELWRRMGRIRPPIIAVIAVRQKIITYPNDIKTYEKITLYL